MGARSWFLVFSDGDAREKLAATPTIDRNASIELAKRLFPDANFEDAGDGDLFDLAPYNNEVAVGVFPGISIIAAEELALDYPSKLDRRFLDAGGNGRVMIHAMHSVVDWFAFAVWENGKLVRSLSLSPDDGILENVGDPMEFELPFWNGEHPAIDDDEDEDAYPFKFHPLELAEETLNALFGFQMEGGISQSLLELEDITLVKLKRRSKAWWKFW